MKASVAICNGVQPASVAQAVERIRVLHLIHSVTHGGIESVLINWVRYMNRSKFDVHIACFAGDRGLERTFLQATEFYGLPAVLQVPWNRRKPFLRAARATADLVKELKIDVLHTHAYYADMVGALTKRYATVKTIATVYVWEKYELHRQIMQVMDWAALKFVDRVTAHCEETRRRTVRLGFKAETVPVLIAGFPDEVALPTVEERQRLRRNAGIHDDELLFINVARIHPEKAHDQLLRSFRIVHDRYPKSRLWISGVGWPKLEENLRELRSALGLETAVDFVGYRQNLWPMLHSADFMIHASHAEGVPIAILYGMSAALPIIVSDVGGLYEVIHQNVTGIRVPENDIDGLANAILRLVEDPDERKRLGLAARQFVTTDYSMRTACTRLENVYREVLGR
jgi:glycosyltransferase involved in cell wall biosynthesis